MIAALVVAAGRTARKVGFARRKKVGTISAIERAVTVLERADISRICVICADSRTEKACSASESRLPPQQRRGADIRLH